MRYVIDCSVVVKWFVPEELSPVAGTLLRQFEAGSHSLLAPESVFAELGHGLRRQVLRGGLTPEESQAFMQDFVRLDVPTVPMRPLVVSAMNLTTRHMSTFYDALYISLAIREDLKVLTADERMVNAFAGLDRTISLASFT